MSANEHGKAVFVTVFSLLSEAVFFFSSREVPGRILVRTVCVIGAGPVGTSSALALQQERSTVTILADRLPGEGLTGDLAAGIGCIFKPSSRRVAGFVLDSYQSWMQLASDPSCPAVWETRLQTVTSESDPSWASAVRDFDRVDERHAAYLTYAFDPRQLGTWRLEKFKQHGGQVVHRPLTAEEVSSLRNGASLPGFDYTVVTMGLRLRALRPEFGLYPIRGVLVHLPETQDRQSFMDEDACNYVISRPNGLVVGGTFDAHVETCSADEKLVIGGRILADANARFGLGLDFGARTRITVGYRPAVSGDLVLEFGKRTAFINGLGGQGWVTGPALSAFVAR
jgi:glycine/D-amino acid oxidase-like deaminating enzyme